MKKFLNYILVAGVAVLGFAGTVSAADVDSDAVNIIKKVNDGLKAVNNTLVVKADNVSYDGVKNATAEAFAKNYNAGDYVVVFDGSAFSVKKLKDSVAVGDEDRYEAVEVGTETINTVTFEATEFNNTDTKNIAAKVKAITDGATITLQDVEAIEYYAKSAKAEDAYKYSKAYSKLIATENGISVKVEVDKDTKARYATAFKGDVQVSEKTEITVTAADTNAIELYVPMGTKPENVKAVLTERINKAIAGTGAKITKLEVEEAGTPATLVIESATKDIINESNIAVKEVNGLDAVTPVASEITSNSTDVTVTADKTVDAGTKLVVEKIANPADLAKAVAKDVKDVVAYSLKLVDADNKEVKFDGVNYTVTVTIPENLKGKNLAAYTIVDGKLEEHKITVDGDKGTFTTTHFSDWVITEVVKVGEDGKVLPNTLDNAASFAFVGVIGLVGMAASALFLNKRN